MLQTDAPAEVTERLLKEHPEIELREGKPVRDLFHRRDDIPSFWGGAAIQSGGGTCSAGFAVRKPSGARFMTTAAHCYAVGATVRTPTSTFFGSVTQRGTLNSWWFFDNRDVELIGGSSYAARVYTGGVFSTSSKAVVGAGDPVAGVTGYCTSGQTSGEQCNQTVNSTGAIVCTQTGCKWPVISYMGGPSQPGDSGGSFYIPARPARCSRAARSSRATARRASRSRGAACRPQWACRSRPDPRTHQRLTRGAEGDRHPLRAARRFSGRGRASVLAVTASAGAGADVDVGGPARAGRGRSTASRRPTRATGASRSPAC